VLQHTLRVDVTLNEAHSRFETTVDGETAFLTFHRNGKRITLIHTETPEALEGKGVGSAVVRFALDYARRNDLVVVPRCPFVRSFLERHPDEAEGLTIDPSGL
jgi:predicted GNAT family acetyltransferase